MDDPQAKLEEPFGDDEALANAVRDYARREVLQWSEIEQGATVLPELESAVHELIETQLGWLPQPTFRLKHEPFMRALLTQYRSGTLEWSGFMKQANEHIKQIRNEVMKGHISADYSAAMYRFYETHLPPYRAAARERVCWLMGYEPPLACSLSAEVWLRSLLADDSFHFSHEATPADLKAASLIRYREILVAKGKEAADASPLLLLEGTE